MPWWAWLWAPVCSATVTFSIAYTTRIGGMVLPTKNLVDCPISNTDDCLGGAARRASFLKNWRQQNPNALILDGGGAYFGRSFYSVFDVAPMASYMNAAGYDAVALQVSDFHGTNVMLSDYLKRLQMPAVCSNIDISRDNLLNVSAPLVNNSGPFLVQPYLVFQVAGVKVGVLSMIGSRVTLQSQPSPQTIVNLGETTSSDALRVSLARLQLAHPDCNIIILIADDYSDVGTTSDMQQVIRTVYGVDVILATSPHVGVQLPEFNRNDINQTVWAPAIRAGGTMVHCLNLTFDDNGAIINQSMTEESLTNATVEDPTVWSDVLAKQAVIDVKYSEVVAYSNIPLTYSYAVDGPMKRILTQSFMEYCDSVPPVGPCDFAILNAGGFTTTLPQGNITLGDVHALFPFENGVSVFQLKGSYVEQAFSWLLDFSFPVVGGLRFAWNPNVTGLGRLVELEGFSSATNSWGPLNTNRFYKVITNSYLRGGGAGLTAFRDQAVNPVDNGKLDFAVFEEYISRHSPLGGESPEFYENCRNATLPLRVGAGDCLVVETFRSASELNRCPTDVNFCASLSSPEKIAFLGTNLALDSNITCNSCSGVGTCIDLACVCSLPSTGHWEGIPTFRGVACSEMRGVEYTSKSTAAVLQFLGSMTLIISGTFSVALVLTRKRRVIRASSPLFGHLIALGSGLGGVAVILVAVNKTVHTCNARFVVGVLSYALIFSSLFAKTYRTHKIFNQKKLVIKRIKTHDLLTIVGVVLVVEVALLLAFFEGGESPLYPHFVTHGDWSSVIQCKQSDQAPTIYIIFILVFNGGLLLWGVYLAFHTRNVSLQEFNESKLIAVSLYNTTVAGLLAIILYYALAESSAVAEAIVGVVIAYVCLFTLLCLYIPKFIAIIRNAEGEVTNMKSVSGTKSLSPLARENAILRSALIALDQDVEAILLAAGRGSVSTSMTEQVTSHTPPAPHSQDDL